MTDHKEQEAPVYAPKHLKLWICCHCLSPRLYGSKSECLVCGKSLHETADYFREDSVPSSQPQIDEAVAKAVSAAITALRDVAAREMPDGSLCWCAEPFEDDDDETDHSEYCANARAVLAARKEPQK